MIRGVLGVIVRVGRVCSVLVGHVCRWMGIHISTVGGHGKISAAMKVAIKYSP